MTISDDIPRITSRSPYFFPTNRSLLLMAVYDYFKTYDQLLACTHNILVTR